MAVWYKIYTVKYGFDENKSLANKFKHGIDFIEAQALWDDPRLLEIPARFEDEERYLVIGRIGGRCWSAVVTYRHECTRIISVRRARKKEHELYESQ